MDKLCFIRALHTDTPAHPQAVVQLHTGTAQAQLTRPSMGAWLLYGLGTENQDLPGYITINPSPNFGGAINYGTAFLPAHFQGTRITDTGEMPNLRRADRHALAAPPARPDPGDEPRPRRARPAPPTRWRASSSRYELAFRMQDRVPALLDISPRAAIGPRCLRRPPRPGKAASPANA